MLGHENVTGEAFMSRTQTKRKTTRRAPARRKATGGGLGPWVVLLVTVAGGIALWDNRAAVMPQLAGLIGTDRPTPPKSAPSTVTPRPPMPIDRTSVASVRPNAPRPPAREATQPGHPVPPLAVAMPGSRPAVIDKAGDMDARASVASVDPSLVGKGQKARFYYCGTSGLDNCVVSGDTFWYRKKKIVLADVAAPGMDSARCQQERDRGFAAKVRLRDLLNSGAFEIASANGGARVTLSNGRSVGLLLADEGLAVPRQGRAKSWCG